MAESDDRLSAVASSDDAIQEFEPDYRFTLANERTFLAWLRTALGLLAAAVAVVQLVPELVIPGARHVVGGILALLAVYTAASGMYRWDQVNKAMRLGLPLPRQRTPLWLGAGFVLVAVLGLGLILSKVVWG